MHVIGTAGHVDHGKSTLVEALSGIHPDRLKEEQEREMTIDLGFAWVTLPGGEEIGIVDVPGHRDFIENMLAGVGGIDAALFVVAADEGVMPQTQEHLAILDILQVNGGVVALTKTDLVDDPEWLDLVEDDVRQALIGTVLDGAPVVRVSARSGEGVKDIAQALSTSLANRPPRTDIGRPRLSVDRVFTIAGFGTVVTGTLIDGSFRVGEDVEILPGGTRGRIRGLQTHKRKEAVTVPGSRTAVNISGVDVAEVHRGDVVAHPGTYQATGRIDVHFRLLEEASVSLKHNMQVKLYLGAAETIARIRLLGVDELKPGESGWLQLEFADQLVAVRGDHYILRRPSPSETLGGGIVVDPHPGKRHKRFSHQVIERLTAMLAGEPTDILLKTLESLGVSTAKDLIPRSGLDLAAGVQALNQLIRDGMVVNLDAPSGPQADTGENSYKHMQQLCSQAYYDTLTTKVRNMVQEYHTRHPLRRGMPREELKSRAGVTAKVFNAMMRRLVSQEVIVEVGPLVFLPGHQITFTKDEQRSISQLLERFAKAPFSPPSVKECIAEVGEDVYQALVELEQLVPVSGDVVFGVDGYQQLVRGVTELLSENGTVTAAQVRDHFKTSRKYALGLLEYLDAIGVTIRDGDVRRLKS